jgi:hypothetical protein
MSENSNRNKSILLAVAGAGLVLGAAILFHWANSTEAEDEDEKIDILAELKAAELDKPKKQGPLLDP